MECSDDDDQECVPPAAPRKKGIRMIALPS